MSRLRGALARYVSGDRTPPAAEALLGLLLEHLFRQFPRMEAQHLVATQDATGIADRYRALEQGHFTVLKGRIGPADHALIEALWRLEGPGLFAVPTSQWEHDALGMLPGQDAAGGRGSDQMTVPVLLDPIQPQDSDIRRTLVQGFRQAFASPLPIAPRPSPQVLQPLADAFPWLERALAAIRQELTLAERLQAPILRLPPLVLLGPPGIGKTRFVITLAEALGRPLRIQPMAGMAEAFVIGGSPWSYKSSDASLAARAMRDLGAADPIILLDDLDKIGVGTEHGHALDALFDLLEPQTARRQLDPFLCARIDTSHISWIATANSLSPLPAALLSRMQVVNLERPRAGVINLILNGFRATLAQDYRVEPEQVPAITAAQTRQLARELDLQGDLRRLYELWRRMIARPELELLEPQR